MSMTMPKAANVDDLTKNVPKLDITANYLWEEEILKVLQGSGIELLSSRPFRL